jgi:hypothetical protein
MGAEDDVTDLVVFQVAGLGEDKDVGLVGSDELREPFFIPLGDNRYGSRWVPGEDRAAEDEVALGQGEIGSDDVVPRITRSHPLISAGR